MGEAFITRRGGGGGPAGLNFEVVGGTTQPTKAKENTIWINTAQEITSWDFGAEMPFLRSNNKNKIVYPFYHTTRTESGITWTDNKDGSITANGTATAAALFRVSAFDSNADHEYLEAGTYTLSGCPAGGSGSTYLMELFILNPVTNTNEAIGRDYGEGFTFTLEHDCKVRVNLNVMSGATVSGITFRPQIEKGSTKTAFVKGDATGHVWIATGASSTVEFNVLKKNGIQVYPISAKQYIGGAWVEKTAKSYLGGEWVEWIPEGALYYRGNECTHNGGAWVNKAWAMNSNGYTGVKADVFQKNAEYITMRLTNSGSAPSTTLIKETAVDLTNINTVTFMFNVTGAQYISFFACKGNETYYLSGTTYSHHNIAEFGGNDSSVRLDVSSLDSGSYIIGIGLAHNADNQTTTLVLKEVMMS